MALLFDPDAGTHVDRGVGQALEQGTGARALAGFERVGRQRGIRPASGELHQHVEVELVPRVDRGGERCAQIAVVDLGAERFGDLQRAFDVAAGCVEVVAADGGSRQPVEHSRLGDAIAGGAAEPERVGEVGERGVALAAQIVSLAEIRSGSLC